MALRLHLDRCLAPDSQPTRHDGQFEDHRVAFPDWAGLKPTTPYGQLPLLSIDGGEPMAQSDAMLRYAGTLATANGVPLYPPEQMLAIEEALGFVGDLQRDWRPAVGIALSPALYGHDVVLHREHPQAGGTPQELAATVKRVREVFMAEAFPRFMGQLTKKLGDRGGYLVGLAPTIADCVLLARALPLIVSFFPSFFPPFFLVFFGGSPFLVDSVPLRAIFDAVNDADRMRGYTAVHRASCTRLACPRLDGARRRA